jgi:hypothetical protein
MQNNECRTKTGALARSAFCIPHSAFKGVTDGIRTRDIKDHNLALYQLSYSHHLSPLGKPNAAGGVHAEVLPTPHALST